MSHNNHVMIDRQTKVFQVVSPQTWVGQTITDSLAQANQPSIWEIRSYNGLAPVEHIGQADGLWIAPGLLIAHQSWLQTQGRQPLHLPAPSPYWLSQLASSAPTLAGRQVCVAPVSEIASWKHLPEEVGNQPWSQLAQGRVTAFRAARRNLEQLQKDVSHAPADSLIQLSSQVESITEEWRVVVAGGLPVATSGYCVHQPAGNQQVTSIFDGALFLDTNRSKVEEVALQVAQITGLQNATLDLAFTEEHRKGQPIVLECNPLWCSAAYDYGATGMEAFVSAVSSSQHTATTLNEHNWQPDPWMVQEFAHRYASFLNDR